MGFMVVAEVTKTKYTELVVMAEKTLTTSMGLADVDRENTNKIHRAYGDGRENTNKIYRPYEYRQRLQKQNTRALWR